MNREEIALRYIHGDYGSKIRLYGIYDIGLFEKVSMNKAKLGRIYIKLSKTNKIVFRDSFRCKLCNSEATHGIVGQLENGFYALRFGFFEDDKFICMTKDHKVPVSKGGSSLPDNLECLCYSCNQFKSNHNVSDGRKVILYKVAHDELLKKSKDFKICRSNIISMLRSMPWYYKLLGIDRYLERKLKQPLKECGYYQEKKTTRN